MESVLPSGLAPKFNTLYFVIADVQFMPNMTENQNNSLKRSSKLHRFRHTFALEKIETMMEL